MGESFLIRLEPIFHCESRGSCCRLTSTNLSPPPIDSILRDTTKLGAGRPIDWGGASIRIDQGDDSPASSLRFRYDRRVVLPDNLNAARVIVLIRICLLVGLLTCSVTAATADRPNILIAIADDQSFPHTSAYGTSQIKTPGFDRVAKQGVLFQNAFTPAPGCSPMRAAFLTGREIWQIGHAGTHASFFPRDLPVFTEQLADAGYHVGMTGKGWGPGRAVDWPHNPAGKSYSSKKMDAPSGVSKTDYAANFEDFFGVRKDDQPFCFWFGSHEPHRAYRQGIGKESGIDLSKIDVPGFLPDSDTVRGDIADYFFEIQWFDSHLVRMLDFLEEKGELDNTLVIVTSDNGMPFPRAKANLYEYGIHMPLAICWPKRIEQGRITDDLVSLIDVTRTIFDAAEVEPRQEDQLSGFSLLPQFAMGKPPQRREVFSGRERHSSSRFNSLSYPCRCIRTPHYLYIRNFTPERWPAGTPQKFDRAIYNDDGDVVDFKLGSEHGGYHDIDNGPTLQWMITNRDSNPDANLFHAAVAHRPSDELYDIEKDPACMNNLASDPKHRSTLTRLSRQLTQYLTKTGDLRQTDPAAGQIWENYPRVSSLRWFPTPNWVETLPERAPKQDWLEKRRPKAKQ